MDGSRFDTLSRALAHPGSRRRALRGLLTGALGLFGWPAHEDIAAHDLKAKCKKKSGEAKKKCLKKARKHAATHAGETQPPPPPHVCAGRDLCTTPDEENACQTSGRHCECAVTAAGAPFCAATRPRGRLAATCGDCVQGETCIDLAACGEGAIAPFGCVSPCPNGPTCNDELQNGDEIDVDCGGSCPRCANSKRCNSRQDCFSANCVNNVCTACSGSCGGTNCTCLNERCVQNPPEDVTRCRSQECPEENLCLPNQFIQNRFLCYRPCPG